MGKVRSFAVGRIDEADACAIRRDQLRIVAAKIYRISRAHGSGVLFWATRPVPSGAGASHTDCVDSCRRSPAGSASDLF
jgi:hypothetical protein